MTVEEILTILENKRTYYQSIGEWSKSIVLSDFYIEVLDKIIKELKETT